LLGYELDKRDMKMEAETIMYIYIYGWAVWSLALIEKVNVGDIITSIAAGTAWPVSIPAHLLKKLRK